MFYSKGESMKAITILLMALFFSCAKERPFEKVFKNQEIIPKSLITTDENPGEAVVYNKGDADLEMKLHDSIYLYIPTVEQGGYYNAGARSFFVGEEKLAKFKITKDKLEVFKLVIDDNINNNQLNSQAILEIPVTHKDYQCQENADNECSNKEEEKNDVAWNKKSLMEMNFSGMKILESGTLPIDIQNLFMPCYQELSSKVSSWSITKDSVHIIVDKTFKTNILCSRVRTFEDLAKTTFTQRHHYQFKKLNKIAKKNYKPISYNKNPGFGYFFTEKKKLSADNREVYYSKTNLMKRFAPNEKIKYYLSANLMKPENASILKATKESVAMINESFQKAGNTTEIELMATPREEGIHDVKNSIILVEEPLTSGLLGYGPSIANPLTGEIVQAQTVMYLGNHIKYIRRTYDELVSRASQKQAVKAEAESSADDSKASEMIAEHQFAPMLDIVTSDALDFETSLRVNGTAAFFEKQRFNAYMKTQESDLPTMQRLDALFESESDYDLLAKRNMFHGDFLNSDKLVKDILKKNNWKVNELKPWMLLSDSEREDVIDLIVPHIWKSVLIHELGHNLGLRHNFSGSEDKDNFYTKDELDSMGIEQDIKLSSVMDYNYSDLDALPILGKYDIAALKFGYSQEIDTKDGKTLSFEKSVSEIKPADLANKVAFKYCSDEGVSTQPMCNRFDEGTTYNEVVDHYIRNFYKSYKYSNTKLDKLHFSEYDNLASLNAKYQRTFLPLRRFFEVFEIYDDAYKKGQITQGSANYTAYMELYQAVNKIAIFAINVLKEVDAHCQIVNAMNGQGAWYSLSMFRETSCAAIGPIQTASGMFIPVAQVGTPLNHVKSAKNGSSYIDEIDVRGFWMDKILAVHLLTKKTFGSPAFDSLTGSFVSRNVLLAKDYTVGEALKDVMISQIDGIHTGEKLVVSLADGSVSKQNVQINQAEADFIENDINRMMNRVVGMKKGATHITKLLLNFMLTGDDGFDAKLSNPLVKDYIVYDTMDATRPNQVKTQYGTYSFPDGSVAIKSIVEKMNLSEEIKSKDSGALEVISTGIIQGKDSESIQKDVATYIDVVSKNLYDSFKAILDALSSINKEKVEAFLAGDESSLSKEEGELLKSLPKTLLEVKVKNAEASGEVLAEEFVVSNIGGADSLNETISELSELTKATLKSIAKGSLNTKEHYEKVLSSLAL